MNYLAHAFLSFGNEPLIVGNFIADHIKIARAGYLPAGVKQGMFLHRKIDYFTDTHPLFTRSKRYFYDGFERYSGILVDIYYDHLLAKNFSKYSDINLEDFTQNIYSLLQRNEQHLPESSKHFLKYVISNNTFYRYSTLEGIELVLKHLSGRINHGVWLNESVPLFTANEKLLEAEFHEFMEDLIREAKAFKI